MEDSPEKEVNIEIGNISKTLDGKNYEVSLNEINTENGNQYIQIKNSDTMNNTKGIETENQNDEILFKKLNQTENSTTTKDIEDTIDIDVQQNNEEIPNYIQENMINKDNSDGFYDQSEREFFDKIIVRNEEPYEELTSENYSITRCNKITTIKFEGNIFSYLTNPLNPEHFFYIQFNTKNNLFDLMDMEIYKKNYSDFTRIPYNHLKNFVGEMNFAIQDLNKEIKNKIFSIRFWKAIKFLITLIILILILYWFFFNGEKYFSISDNTNQNIFYGLVIIFSLLLIFVLYSFSHDLTTNYEICKILLNKQEDLDKIIYSWNYDYFNPNLNMICMIPITFPYILITLVPNKRLFLEDHEIYD